MSEFRFGYWFCWWSFFTLHVLFSFGFVFVFYGREVWFCFPLSKPTVAQPPLNIREGACSLLTSHEAWVPFFLLLSSGHHFLLLNLEPCGPAVLALFIVFCFRSTETFLWYSSMAMPFQFFLFYTFLSLVCSWKGGSKGSSVYLLYGLDKLDFPAVIMLSAHVNYENEIQYLLSSLGKSSDFLFK